MRMHPNPLQAPTRTPGPSSESYRLALYSRVDQDIVRPDKVCGGGEAGHSLP